MKPHARDHRHLLLVEDELIIALEERLELERYGYAVSHAASGEEALVIIADPSIAVDLVLMDIDLGGGMDGTETAARILREHDLPVVFLSSHTEPDIVERTEAITSYGYVVKNTGITVLDASIKMAFKLFDAHRKIENELAERKRAEEALAESNRLLSLFLEKSPIYTYIKEVTPSESRVLIASENYADMIGIRGSQMTGKTMEELFPADFARKISRDDWDVVRNGMVLRLDEELNGRMYTTIKFPIALKERRLLAGYTIDITEQKRIESALRETTQLYETIFRLSPEIIAVTTEDDGRYLAVNDAHERVTGYGADEVIGHVVAEFDVWDGQDDRSRFMERLRREGVIHNHSRRFRNRQGDHFPALLSMARVTLSNVPCIISIVSDISQVRNVEVERQEALAAVHERERVFATLVDNLPGFVYRCANDRDWTMEYVSDGCRAITGYAPEDFLGNRHLAFNDVVHPDYREALWQQWQDILARRGYFEEEYPVIAADGQTRWVWERGRGIYGDDGALLFLEGFITDITARKSVEEALSASEMKFRLITEQSDDLIALTDERGYITYASPSSRSLCLSEPQEMCGRHFTEFLDPSSIALALEHYTRDRESGLQTRHLEVLMRRSDGSVFCAEVNGSALVMGDATASLVVIRDITWRKQAEAELLRQKAFSETVINSMPGIFYLFTEEGRFVQWNTNYSVVSGYSGDEIAAMHPLDFFDDDEKPVIESVIRETFSSGESDVEAHFVTKSGTAIPYYLTGRLMVVGDDRYLAGMGIDVTAIKMVEEELVAARDRAEESEKRFRNYFDFSPVPLALSTASGAILSFNKHFVETFGYSSKEIPTIDQWMLTAYPDEEYRRQVADVWGGDVAEAVRTRAATPVREYRVRCRNGEEKIVEITMYPEKDVYIGMFLDVTERHRARSLNEQQVREKEVLLREVHHRVKNNITTIGGMLKLQADSATGDESRTILRDAISRVESMRLIYDTVLLEGDYRNLSVREYLETLVRAVVDIFPDKKQIALEYRIDEVSLDVKRLQSLGIVVNELVTNAMKYGFAGRERGRIVTSLTRTGERLCLAVHDDGIGVPEGFDANTSTGFGLTIVRMLVKQLRGSFIMHRDGGTRCMVEFAL